MKGGAYEKNGVQKVNPVGPKALQPKSGSELTKGQRSPSHNHNGVMRIKRT